MKKPMCILFILFSALFLQAQGYNITGGIRMGTDWGITGKYRFDKRLTVEGILQSSVRKEEVILTGLVEKHVPLVTKRFNFYTGIGLHKGWNSEPATEATAIKDPFGVTAIAGVEFNLGRTNISWDFKPAFNIIGGDRVVYTQSGISLRYVFEKRPLFERKNKKRKKGKKKINWKFWEK